MTSKSPSQQILEQLSSLALAFATHVASEAEMKEQVGRMYKILVTGNGVLPLPEIVRQHTDWIAERDQERSDDRADRKDVAAQNKKDVREDRVEGLAFKRQLWILTITTLVNLVLLALKLFVLK